VFVSVGYNILWILKASVELLLFKVFRKYDFGPACNSGKNFSRGSGIFIVLALFATPLVWLYY